MDLILFRNKETRGRDKTGLMMMRRGSEMVIVPSPKSREATEICSIRTSFRLMLAIFAIQQLKKKGNTNISSAPKQQYNFSSLSNSDLNTNEISFDKSKAVKPTSKAHSTRCFKCHRIGHYATKCQNQKPLVTLENEKVETESEKEEFSDLSPILDDYAHEPMAGLKYCEHKNLFSCQSESILDESCLQLNILQPENPSSFELISQFEKDSENVLNKDEFSGPLNPLDIGTYDLGFGSFLSIQEEPDKEQNSGHQTNQERSSSIQKPDQTQALDRGYIKSHFASLDDPFISSQFQKCHLPSRIISNTS
ncbi:hypothetical protein YC2023_054330 [Brassica napus]